MPFSFGLSEELKDQLKILAKRDQKITEALNKKIKEIINSDEFTIDHYKNLRYGLSDYKRVHIAKSFVLLFKVFKKENFSLFDRFDHHDNIYK
ncbi:MAG: addiction module toxin RelE [Candidatus Diapherotrites archaeon]|nr:addiction module toxin RelE [Candidatus Diapherotrites archaeon]